jgi:hypothetical protein
MMAGVGHREIGDPRAAGSGLRSDGALILMMTQ